MDKQLVQIQIHCPEPRIRLKAFLCREMGKKEVLSSSSSTGDATLELRKIQTTIEKDIEFFVLGNCETTRTVRVISDKKANKLMRGCNVRFDRYSISCSYALPTIQ